MFDRLDHHVRKTFRLELRWLHVHLLRMLAVLLVLAVLIVPGAFVAGLRLREHRDFSHRRADLAIQPQGAQVALTHPKTLPSSAAMIPHTMPGIGDQDGIGSCQCWAAVNYQATYLKRVATNNRRYPRLSAKFCYDVAVHGQGDVGTMLDAAVASIPSTGVPTFGQDPYPPNTISWPISQTFYAEAGQRKFPITAHWLGVYQGGGYGLVQLIKEKLAEHVPVNVGLPVYPEFDNASYSGGWIGMPQPGEHSRGGHAVTAVGYNDATGAFKIKNQWGIYWGASGFGYLPYQFVATYAFDAGYLSLTTGSAKPHAGRRIPRPEGKHPHLHRAPRVNPTLAPTGTSWYVRGVVTADTGQDISGLVNAAGDRYKLWPVGLAALLGVESAWNAGANRYDGYYDTSGGLCQVTTLTARTAYGFDGWGDDQILAWEDNPANCVDLGARVARDMRNVCGYDWTILYECYNWGPYNDRSFYGSPAADNAAYESYLSWYNTVLVYHQGGIAPQPKFSARRWYSSGRTVSPYEKVGGKKRLYWTAWLWFAQDRNGASCHGVISKSEWFGPAKGRSTGYTTQRFADCRIFAWPKYGPRAWKLIAVRHIAGRHRRR